MGRDDTPSRYSGALCRMQVKRWRWRQTDKQADNATD